MWVPVHGKGGVGVEEGVSSKGWLMRRERGRWAFAGATAQCCRAWRAIRIACACICAAVQQPGRYMYADYGMR